MTYPLSVVKRSDPPDGPLPSPAASIGIRSLVVALVLTSLVAVIALGISYRIVDTQFPVPLPVQASAGLEPSSSEEDDDPQIYIPDLVGSNIEKVLLDPLYRSLFTFQIERSFLKHSLPARSFRSLRWPERPLRLKVRRRFGFGSARGVSRLRCRIWSVCPLNVHRRCWTALKFPTPMSRWKSLRERTGRLPPSVFPPAKRSFA